MGRARGKEKDREPDFSPRNEDVEGKAPEASPDSGSGTGERAW